MKQIFVASLRAWTHIVRLMKPSALRSVCILCIAADSITGQKLPAPGAKRRTQSDLDNKRAKSENVFIQSGVKERPDLVFLIY